MFRALLPPSQSQTWNITSLCCPGYRSHSPCSAQKKANALHTEKPLVNPRTVMLLITYTYPCASLHHSVWISAGEKEREERWREDWPVSHASLLFCTTIRNWPLISFHQEIPQVITRAVHCDSFSSLLEAHVRLCLFSVKINRAQDLL